MSRFEDLDRSLQEEEAARQSAEKERAEKMFEAGAKHLPDLQKAYKVLGDFYYSLLRPRDYKLYPRKKEGPTPNELRHINDRTILYAYVANIVSPQKEQPYNHDFDISPTWLNPVIGEMDYHVWHPNVALHFATILTPRAGSLEGEFDLSVKMRAWGLVDVAEDSLISQGITISFGDAGWEHMATFISIKPDEHLGDQIETGLRLLTPNIIHHKEAFHQKQSS